MLRPSPWSAAGLLTLAAVLAGAPPPAQAQYRSGYYYSRPGYAFGFGNSFGGGRYGSFLYYRRGNRVYASGYQIGRGNYGNFFYYRNGGFANAFGNWYGPGLPSYGPRYRHRRRW
jgi:hypothetical protein